ncbi:hypothetical protein BD779DRAFT_1504080, partial [Infundibulicybe gibba]
MSTQKVSFTIRRPTPVSRAESSGADSDGGSSFKAPALPRHMINDSTPGSPLARSLTSSPNPDQEQYHSQEPDSSDEEDDKLQDELVTGFDKFGVQRLNQAKKVKQAPLVIPALKNRDWRDLARKRRSAAQYVPASAKAETGKDGSVGGLGVKDTINSGPVLSGLQVKKLVKKEDQDGGAEMLRHEGDIKMETEETEDQKALRAILAGTDDPGHDGPLIDIIPTPISEADAYKQDVDDLPDVATLEDYTEGTAASRKPGKGIVDPYLPEARPALLGIGAKEREVLDDGSKKRNGGNTRPERRYVPSRSPKRSYGSTTSSRRNSRSPKGRDGHRESKRRESDYEYERDRRGGRSDRDRSRRDRSRDSSRKARTTE